MYVRPARPCADPGIFVRGGPGQSDKKSSDNVFFFFFFFFFFLFSAYFKEVKWSISKKSIIFKVPEGSNIFQGVQLFPGGPTDDNNVLVIMTTL